MEGEQEAEEEVDEEVMVKEAMHRLLFLMIRATLVDHVIKHGLTMREAGQRVPPHLSRFTAASVI